MLNCACKGTTLVILRGFYSTFVYGKSKRREKECRLEFALLTDHFSDSIIALTMSQYRQAWLVIQQIYTRYIQYKIFEIYKNFQILILNILISTLALVTLTNASEKRLKGKVSDAKYNRALSLSLLVSGFHVYPLLLSGSFRVIQSDLVAGFDEKSRVSRFLRVLTFALPLSRRGTMRYESLGSRIVTERSTLRTLDGNSSVYIGSGRRWRSGENCHHPRLLLLARIVARPGLHNSVRCVTGIKIADWVIQLPSFACLSTVGNRYQNLVD